MTNILLALIAALLLVGIGAFALFLLRARALAAYFQAEIESAKATVVDFMTASEPGQQSPLAKSVDAVGASVARAVVMQFKATFMGAESGAARGLKALEGAAVEDQAEQLGLSGILSAFPTVRRTLKRNPGLWDFVAPMVARLGQRSNGDSARTGGSEPPRFRLGG